MAGTGTGGAIDIRRLGRALTQAGIDSRHWVSYGTVATVDDDGDIDFTDVRAVYIGPQGVECDVVLEPLNLHVVCIYAGIQGGRDCSFMSPIRAGDRVLVCLPDGDPTVPPVIQAILHSADHRMPMEGGLPIFQNDRILLFAQNVDVEVRTANGGRLHVKQDNTVDVIGASVHLGAADASEQLVEGTTYRSAEHELNSGPLGLAAAFDLLQAAAVGPLAPLKPGFLQAKAALEAFEAQAGGFLSDQVRTK
jgi:hypothetical protein